MDISTFQQILLLSLGKGRIDRTDGPFATKPASSTPYGKIAFSTGIFVGLLRAVSTLFCTFASIAVVHFADSGLDVFKDCVTFIFITEIDSLMFSAAKKGLLGERMLKTSNALETKVGINTKINYWTTYIRMIPTFVAGVGIAVLFWGSCVK